MSLNLQQLARILKLEFRGDAGLMINGVASAQSALAGDLCFIRSKKYVDAVTASKCSAVILPAELATVVEGKAQLLSENPQYSFVKAIKALGLEPQPLAETDIHPSAQIVSSARIGSGVSIGALAVIEGDVEIGAGTVIERSAVIGRQCVLHSQVMLERGVSLGDRGALDDTIIKHGCKLDNLIQIGHNVRIGAHTVIAASAAIAGSAIIGRYCVISGGARIRGHISIADNVRITATSVVLKVIKQTGVYSSGTLLLENSV